MLTTGIGFTVMVKLVDVPVHVTPEFVKIGVIVIVAVTGAVEVLVAGKTRISPEPLAARPMEVWLFVQLKTVPWTSPVKETREVWEL